MREVLKPGRLFFDPDSEYATHPKFESLRAAYEQPFFSFFWAEAQLMLLCSLNVFEIVLQILC